MKLNSVMVIGVGGVGGWLIEPLTKLLSYHPHGTKMIYVVDGDEVEKSNLNRQNFSQENVGLSKTRAIYKKTKLAEINYIPKYLTYKTANDIFQYLKEPFLLVTSVDNQKTRKLIYNKLKSFQDYYWINPSNGYDNSQTSIHIKRRGVENTSDPKQRYANLRENLNEVEEEEGEGCEVLSVFSPQLLAANYMASCSTLMMVNNILDDRHLNEEIIGSLDRLGLKAGGLSVERGSA